MQDEEDKYRYVFEHSVTGMSLTQPSGQLDANPALCEMLGYSLAELQSRTWQDITHLDDIELTKGQMKLLIQGKQSNVQFTKRFIRRDGMLVWADIHSSVRMDKDGKPLHFISTAIDITERKLGEQKMAEKNAELERFNALMVGRELKMARLKKEINVLLARLGEPPRYPRAESESANG